MEHKNMGLRNEKESNGMISRNHSESYPGMTGKTTKND